MRRKSGPGIDGTKWKHYRKNFNDNLHKLIKRIKNNEWHPMPLKTVQSVYFTGKILTKHIPSVEDRIVHRTIRNILEPVLDKYAFHDFVSGFRKGRSRLTAISQSVYYLDLGLSFVVNIDVEKVSEGYTTDEAINTLARYISDGVFLTYLKKVFNGLPTTLAIGSGLSPILMNVRLTPIDDEIAKWNVVRFADNYCIFCNSQEDAKDKYKLFEAILAEHKLRVALDKSGILINPNPEDLFLI